jgi:hypothetical protein
LVLFQNWSEQQRDGCDQHDTGDCDGNQRGGDDAVLEGFHLIIFYLFS